MMTNGMLAQASEGYPETEVRRRKPLRFGLCAFALAAGFSLCSGMVRPVAAQPQPGIPVLPASLQRAVLTNPGGEAFVVILLDHAWMATGDDPLRRAQDIRDAQDAVLAALSPSDFETHLPSESRGGVDRTGYRHRPDRAGPPPAGDRHGFGRAELSPSASFSHAGGCRRPDGNLALRGR